MFSRRSPLRLTLPAAILACIVAGSTSVRARAEALLLVDADTGKVLHAENATYPWYPASVTKLMTLYTTLRALKEGRITLDTLFTVSAQAAAQSPTKMGFPVGTQVTVDNAIKMMMVKSANDMAVLLAEGVGGSIDGFAGLMMANAHQLGMTQTNYVNPNGLPADEQITSARDLAILARALMHDFPEYDYYWHLPGIKMGKRIVRNYNPLLGRYPGTDGMKTGFICASGFNLVATASRDGRHLIAVVLGAPSGAVRAIKAAQLLEQGFNSGPLSWLTPSLGNVDSLVPINAAPADLHEETCGPHRKRPAAKDEDVEANSEGANAAGDSPYSAFLSSLRPQAKGAALLQQEAELGEPVVVYTGPTRAPGAPAPDAKQTKIASRLATKQAPAMAAVGSVPWTGFSPAASSTGTAGELNAAVDSGPAVPLPRARPKIVSVKPRVTAPATATQ